MKGFTLFEILLTVIIVAVGSISLMQAVNTGFFASSEIDNKIVAINLAQEKMEDIRNKAFANVTDETKAAVTNFSAFSREVVVANNSPVANMRQVTVNVYWTSKSDEQSVSLVTFVSDI